MSKQDFSLPGQQASSLPGQQASSLPGQQASSLPSQQASSPSGQQPPGSSGKPATGFPSRHQCPEGMKKTPAQHKDSRRGWFHDYCSPGYYHITATAHPGSPRFCKLPACSAAQLKGEGMLMPVLTPLGERIRAEIQGIPTHHPKLRIIRFVVMPDHIHMVVHVQERLERMLGRELSGFFGACSKHYKELAGLQELKTLFKPFNDTIIFNYPQLNKAVKYVENNPRRAIIKSLHPDLFRRYLHLRLGEHEYAAYGNIFLVRHFHLLPVRIHRRWSPGEFEEYEARCLSMIEHGAVAISPFIHSAEKRIRDKAIERGARVIELQDIGFEERFKPTGRRFELCAEGRLLILAPWPDNTGRKSSAGYTEFHKMNDMALAIANLPADTRMNICGDR